MGKANANRMSLLDSFAAVEKPAVGCWVWPFSKNGAGRAMFGGRSAPNQLYEILIGPVPNGHGVLHTCDNPACVRPEHWFTGDQQANVADAIAKGRFRPGRAPPGERHPGAKVTEKQAIKIRALVISERAKNGGKLCRGTLAKLQRDFSIGPTQISRIANGQRWGHL